ncbi:hypothetical protein EUGRSUZ_I01288 [Eucalyptus grandis]|uniref:Uncharacterized protein n=2 Tax=Eucalyptus grandis TaxID=71139 RepID=A0ACC3JES3_EUCGR|nr:hypothetical protein EUGRSUZ_I01288 [Eucalyptus grandis]
MWPKREAEGHPENVKPTASAPATEHRMGPVHPAGSARNVKHIVNYIDFSGQGIRTAISTHDFLRFYSLSIAPQIFVVSDTSIFSSFVISASKIEVEFC